MECVSAHGHLLPNIPILQGRQNLASMYSEQPHGDMLITFSDSGYGNNECAMDWIRHFEAFSSRQSRVWYKAKAQRHCNTK